MSETQTWKCSAHGLHCPPDCRRVDPIRALFSDEEWDRMCAELARAFDHAMMRAIAATDG